ncbi:MAG: efflux transporter outer membrane subunit [Deltaproteobacteria bacterium]
MRKDPVVLLTAIALLFNGCSMIPKYVRPKSPVPARLPAQKISAEGGLGTAALKWEKVFPDRKLQQVIGIALLNNRDLRIAALNVEQAKGFYGIQRAALFPSVSALATGDKQRVPGDLSGTGKAETVSRYSVNLGVVSWEVDLFGRVRSLKEQALQEYLGTEQARRATQTALVSEIALAYLTLAADRKNLELSQSTLQAQRDTYGMIKARYDKGVSNEEDLRRSQTQVDTAARDIARYEQLVSQDKNALDLLAGCAVPRELLPSDLSGISPLRDISPGLSSEVLLRRPDIMAAEHQLKAAYAVIGAARAAFFPSISLTTLLGTASSQLSGLFDSGSRAWSFAPQAVMPLFDMRTRAAYRVSKVQRDIAVAGYEKAVQTAFREVADTLAVRNTIDQQLSAQQSIVDSAQKVYELANKKYLMGVDGYLSVLDAQRSLYGAQQALTSLQLTRLASQVRLYAVLGGDGEEY